MEKLHDVTTRVINELDEKRKEPEKYRPVDIGISELRKYAGGIAPSKYTAILGAAKSYKTTVSNHIATVIASKNRGKVAYFTLEELNDAFGERALVRLTSKTSRTDIRDIMLTDANMDELREVNKQLENVDMYVEDKCSRFEQIVQKAQELDAEWIVVDYAQLVEGPGKEQERIARVSQQIVKARNTTGKAWIVVFQLNDEGTIHGSRAAYKDADLLLQVSEMLDENKNVVSGSVQMEILPSRQAQGHKKFEVAVDGAHGRITDIPKFEMDEMIGD